MEYLDLRGMSCPQPVIETKRLLESRDLDELRLVLDNGPARENVTRFLVSEGYRVTVEKEERDEATMRAERGDTAQPHASGESRKILVLVDGATVGRGNDVLGTVLMKSFIHTLKEISPRPWRIIFINEGVKLAAEGSDLLNPLAELEQSGVEILSCGTCLDFFNLKEKLRAGEVTNMYEIVSSLAAAASVLRP